MEYNKNPKSVIDLTGDSENPESQDSESQESESQEMDKAPDNWQEYRIWERSYEIKLAVLVFLHFGKEVSTLYPQKDNYNQKATFLCLCCTYAGKDAIRHTDFPTKEHKFKIGIFEEIRSYLNLSKTHFTCLRKTKCKEFSAYPYVNAAQFDGNKSLYIIKHYDINLEEFSKAFFSETFFGKLVSGSDSEVLSDRMNKFRKMGNKKYSKSFQRFITEMMESLSNVGGTGKSGVVVKYEEPECIEYLQDTTEGTEMDSETDPECTNNIIGNNENNRAPNKGNKRKRTNIDNQKENPTPEVSLKKLIDTRNSLLGDIEEIQKKAEEAIRLKIASVKRVSSELKRTGGLIHAKTGVERAQSTVSNVSSSCKRVKGMVSSMITFK